MLLVYRVCLHMIILYPFVWVQHVNYEYNFILLSTTWKLKFTLRKYDIFQICICCCAEFQVELLPLHVHASLWCEKIY